MSRKFTFTTKKCMQLTACVLLMLSTGCTAQTNGNASDVKLSANPAENNHLKHIFFGRNEDSISKYAEADYTSRKYYIFWTGMPAETKFNSYLAAYAQKRYQLILVGCGCKNSLGAYYYNNRMTTLLQKTSKKPLEEIYLEAKEQYNKTLLAKNSNSFTVLNK
jgi:hypothetical protein